MFGDSDALVGQRVEKTPPILAELEPDALPDLGAVADDDRH
jgi:hypothetical protein